MSLESRPVATISLSARLMDKVLKSGFSTVADLQSIPQGQLQFELTLTPDEARELWTQLHPPAVFPLVLDVMTAQTQEWRWMPITTSSKTLDRLLSTQQGSGGVRPGEVTEFCGPAGVGKSQLGMQLAINVQLPPELGGVNGSSIYLDSEGSFIAKRAQEMAMSAVALLHDRGYTDWTADTLLEGVRYCRVLNPVQLLAMIRMLRGIVRADSKVRLIVVDSIAFLFRSNISNVRMRTKLIGLMAKQLTEIAQEFNLAVVVMNHMSTKFEFRGGPGERGKVPSSGTASGPILTMEATARPQPALGETWAKACTHRIRLDYSVRGPSWRTATLFKSPTVQEQTIQFKITQEGIQDVTSQDLEGAGKTGDKIKSRQGTKEGVNGDGDDEWPGEYGEEGSAMMELLAKTDWADMWDGETEEEQTTAAGSRGSPASEAEEKMQSQPPSPPTIG
ncbi:DNA repair protein rad51c [Actinomortierella ambigua]|nr:DNA repair protein rad51c [Actinomortierella ambigua]